MGTIRFVSILCVFVAVCNAADIYVSHSGNDNTGDGTSETPYRSIKKAVDNLGAGDTVKIVNDSTYTMALSDESIAGSWETSGGITHWWIADVSPEWGSGEHDGKVAYFTGDVALDIYAYIIDGSNDATLSFTAGEVSGREPDDEDTCTLVGIGDQHETLVLDDDSGDPADGVWLTITSADTADPATLDYSGKGGASGVEAVLWDQDMYKITYLIFTDGISETQNVYTIENDNNDGYEGLWIENCTFNYVKGAFHNADATSRRIVIKDCTMSVSAYTSHSAMITLAGIDECVINNTLDGRGVNGNNARAGIVVGGTGSVIIGNIIHDWFGDSDAATALNLIAGIYSIADSAIIANNTFYDIEVDHANTTYAGAILWAGTGVVSLCYNNIISSCTKGINLVDTTSEATFLDYNCVYSCTTGYVNCSAGSNSITTDPQFLNASGDDFRLLPTSPCLNTGKPTLFSGYTSMGAWQRKSMLGTR